MCHRAAGQHRLGNGQVDHASQTDHRDKTRHVREPAPFQSSNEIPEQHHKLPAPDRDAQAPDCERTRESRRAQSKTSQSYEMQTNGQARSSQILRSPAGSSKQSSQNPFCRESCTRADETRLFLFHSGSGATYVSKLIQSAQRNRFLKEKRPIQQDNRRSRVDSQTFILLSRR